MKRRAILIAFSLASAPPFVKKNASMSPGVISASLAPRRARGSVAMNGLAYASVAACSWIAAMTRGWPWPMFVHISWLLKSRKRLPSGVQNHEPFAPATGMGSALPCAVHSKIVCRFVSATISSPDSVPGAIVVAMEVLLANAVVRQRGEVAVAGHGTGDLVHFGDPRGGSTG